MFTDVLAYEDRKHGVMHGKHQYTGHIGECI